MEFQRLARAALASITRPFSRFDPPSDTISGEGAAEHLQELLKALTDAGFVPTLMRVSEEEWLMPLSPEAAEAFTLLAAGIKAYEETLHRQEEVT